jgi:citrate lyase synthetase
MNGIEFVEIPRIKTGDDIISASRVRKLIEEKKWEEIQLLIED